MKLDGFSIRGYRSFGAKHVRIRDLAKVNIVIGANNSGKSNVLRFCQVLSSAQPPHGGAKFDRGLDYHKGLDSPEIQCGIQVKRGAAVSGRIYQALVDVISGLSEKVPEWENEIWFEFPITGQIKREDSPAHRMVFQRLEKALASHESNRLASQHLGYTGGTHEKRVSDLAKRMVNNVTWSFDVVSIDAFRKITEAEEVSGESGAGLISRLRKLQNPSRQSYSASKEKFEAVNQFLRDLVGDDGAELEIPADDQEILVHLDGRILPLESLGTGIHELVILAAAVTIVEDKVFCIEEPEIHLHPSLQKKFVRYLIEKTQNQYLISTHSNAFFDMGNVNIYHCRLVNGATQCELVTSHLQKSNILTDLGYRASDLLQANYVIWVEGPSDRIYISHWIRRLRPDLKEGLHFSIMFYGGRLLSHLTFDDPEVDEFIQLARLNRNAAIVIDSDRSKANMRLNNTKLRVKKSFEEGGQLTWVTQGRTIENYLSEPSYQQCLQAVHDDSAKPRKWSQYKDMTYCSKDSKKKPINKVRMARGAEKVEPDFSVLDLEVRIRRLIREIDQANGLD